jgi:hypothetical protein
MFDADLVKQAVKMTFTIASLRDYCQTAKIDLERRASFRCPPEMSSAFREQAEQFACAEQTLGEMAEHGFETLDLTPPENNLALAKQILQRAPVYA